MRPHKSPAASRSQRNALVMSARYRYVLVLLRFLLLFVYCTPHHVLGSRVSYGGTQLRLKLGASMVGIVSSSHM